MIGIQGQPWTARDGAVAVFLSVAVGLYIFGEQIGRIEGRSDPAVLRFLPKIVPSPGADTVIVGTMDIVRAECDDPRVRVALVRHGRSAEVIPTFLEGVKARPGGEQGFGPWRLNGLREDDFPDTVFEVSHRCSWRPWRVTTRLYPAR